MRRSLGFQQQGYANEGFHEEVAWHSKNDFHKQFSGSGVHMNPGAANRVDFDQFSKHHDSFHQDGSWHSSSGGHLHGSNSGGKFSFAGNGMMNKTHSSGGQFGYVSEDAEYESYRVSNHGPTKLRVDEMRYERSNIINFNDHGHGHSNPYGHGHGHGTSSSYWKPNIGHKVEWVAKGV